MITLTYDRIDQDLEKDLRELLERFGYKEYGAGVNQDNEREVIYVRSSHSVMTTEHIPSNTGNALSKVLNKHGYKEYDLRLNMAIKLTRD